MPGMSGVEFVTWLREQTYTRETPVLMVTAERDIARIAEAIESGANEYIIKPFSREAIEEKLQLVGIRAAS
jgi:two-component system chemotaxis response regulator CheY